MMLHPSNKDGTRAGIVDAPLNFLFVFFRTLTGWLNKLNDSTLVCKCGFPDENKLSE
jgi:hypothetical protein